MAHPLHARIGTALGSLVPGYEVILDPACGGSENIPLFLTRKKSNDTEVCNVDALILLGGRARVAIEIEESSILPTQICGKLLTTALAKYYIHRNAQDRPIPLQDVLFIQVLDDARLPHGSKKRGQVEFLRDAILSMGLLATATQIMSYRVFWGSDLGLDCVPLLDAIRNEV